MKLSEEMFKKHPAIEIKKGVFRSFVYTKNLMLAIIDFTNGPWEEPETPHSHVHEQVSYVAEGEIIFYCENQPDQHLKAGDVYAVPSGKKHTVKLLTKKVRLVDSFNPVREDFLN